MKSDSASPSTNPPPKNRNDRETDPEKSKNEDAPPTKGHSVKCQVYVALRSQETAFDLIRDVELPFMPIAGMSLEFDGDFPEDGDDEPLLLDIQDVIWSIRHERFTIICGDDNYPQLSNEELEQLAQHHCEHGWTLEEPEVEGETST